MNCPLENATSPVKQTLPVGIDFAVLAEFVAAAGYATGVLKESIHVMQFGPTSTMAEAARRLEEASKRVIEEIKTSGMG